MYHSRHPKRNIGIFLRPFSTKYFVSRFYIAKPTGTGVPPTAASSTRITKPYYRDGAQRGPTPIITILSHIMTRTLFFHTAGLTREPVISSMRVPRPHYQTAQRGRCDRGPTSATAAITHHDDMYDLVSVAFRHTTLYTL